MNEAVERGIVRWRVNYTGLRGGIIELYIRKNRVSFVKKFVLRNNETFETALKICKEKVFRILHMKNGVCTDLARIANYCIDSYSVEEMTLEERDVYLGKQEIRYANPTYTTFRY